MPTYSAPKIVGPNDGKAGNLGSIGVRFMIDTEETHAGGFSLVEHPLPPRRLAAPLHQHTPRGRVLLRARGAHGRLLGDDVVYAEAGDLVHKPRDQWHTFWNAGDEPCRILEIIAPGGFEDFFDELVDAGLAGRARTSSGWPPSAPATAWSSTSSRSPALCERFGVTFG